MLITGFEENLDPTKSVVIMNFLSGFVDTIAILMDLGHGSAGQRRRDSHPSRQNCSLVYNFPDPVRGLGI